jgi:hypothetical protein
MGEFCLLYLLCMLRFPVPLHSLHTQYQVSTVEYQLLPTALSATASGSD